eukprot:gene11055-4122_t
MTRSAALKDLGNPILQSRPSGRSQHSGGAAEQVAPHRGRTAAQ